MTLTSILTETPITELTRALNSNKAYLSFHISVFNADVCVHIKCTNTYKAINQNTWNGYDFIIENDSTTKFYIEQNLKERN